MAKKPRPPHTPGVPRRGGGARREPRAAAAAPAPPDMPMPQTLDLLHTLRLTGMASALEEQQGVPDLATLPFEDRLGLLLERERLTRGDRRLTRLLPLARLRLAARVEDGSPRVKRGLDRSVFLRLAAGDWLRQHEVVLVVGPTGTGKTWLAPCPGPSARRRGARAPRRSRAPRPARSRRGSERPTGDPRHQPGPGRALARARRRRHVWRRDPRSPRAPRPQDHAHRRLPAQTHTVQLHDDHNRLTDPVPTTRHLNAFDRNAATLWSDMRDRLDAKRLNDFSEIRTSSGRDGKRGVGGM